MRTLNFAILYCLLLLSCQSDKSRSDLLQGIWEYSESSLVNEENVRTFVLTEDFNDRACIIFGNKGVFKSYDHGFCGTGPTKLQITDGKYKRDGSKITLDIEHYLFSDINMDILELDERKLVVKMTR